MIRKCIGCMKDCFVLKMINYYCKNCYLNENNPDIDNEKIWCAHCFEMKKRGQKSLVCLGCSNLKGKIKFVFTNDIPEDNDTKIISSNSSEDSISKDEDNWGSEGSEDGILDKNKKFFPFVSWKSLFDDTQIYKHLDGNKCNVHITNKVNGIIEELDLTFEENSYPDNIVIEFTGLSIQLEDIKKINKRYTREEKRLLVWILDISSYHHTLRTTVTNNLELHVLEINQVSICISYLSSKSTNFSHIRTILDDGGDILYLINNENNFGSSHHIVVPIKRSHFCNILQCKIDPLTLMTNDQKKPNILSTSISLGDVGKPANNYIKLFELADFDTLLKPAFRNYTLYKILLVNIVRRTAQGQGDKVWELILKRRDPGYRWVKENGLPKRIEHNISTKDNDCCKKLGKQLQYFVENNIFEFAGINMTLNAFPEYCQYFSVDNKKYWTNPVFYENVLFSRRYYLFAALLFAKNNVVIYNSSSEQLRVYSKEKETVIFNFVLDGDYNEIFYKLFYEDKIMERIKNFDENVVKIFSGILKREKETESHNRKYWCSLTDKDIKKLNEGLLDAITQRISYINNPNRAKINAQSFINILCGFVDNNGNITDFPDIIKFKKDVEKRIKKLNGNGIINKKSEIFFRNLLYEDIDKKKNECMLVLRELISSPL